MTQQESICIGENLQYYRDLHGYSQTGIARRLGVSRSVYTQYEAGLRTPCMDLILDLALLYHISVDMLLDPRQLWRLADGVDTPGGRARIASLLEIFSTLSDTGQQTLLGRAQSLHSGESPLSYSPCALLRF